MSDININEWAVWYKSQSNEEVLDDDSNPILHSLQWKDPSDGDFVLKRLPKGFARVGGSASPGSSSNGTLSRRTSVASLETGGVGAGAGGPGLGPQLPYNDDDEDLLLSVMITRQSGSGLGFKLTPAYLLQMCITYSYLNKDEESLKRLLTKIAALVTKTVAGNAGNPEVLLFWASNALKLQACFSMQKKLLAVYKEVAMANMEQTVTAALENMLSCKRNGVALPTDLTSGGWESAGELRVVILKYCEKLDATMSRENLQEVVNRITAAMPTPKKTTSPPKSPSKEEAPPAFNLGGATVTSTTSDVKEVSTPGGGDGGEGDAEAGEETSESEKTRERPGIDPLPEEWEELVDQETKHRFFANHLTRQTSWTDPRDKLITVSLTKGATGLGLGISGAKRTWDDRLVLGIFVSSLVANAAAAVDGTLSEGDEILEVQGHSLIGVSREYAIGFLKNIQLNDTITLLVSQEPETWVNPATEKAALRHTAL
jgi:afadin